MDEQTVTANVTAPDVFEDGVVRVSSSIRDRVGHERNDPADFARNIVGAGTECNWSVYWNDEPDAMTVRWAESKPRAFTLQ